MVAAFSPVRLPDLGRRKYSEANKIGKTGLWQGRLNGNLTADQVFENAPDESVFFEGVLQPPEAGQVPRVIAVEGADQHGGIEDNLHASAVSRSMIRRRTRGMGSDLASRLAAIGDRGVTGVEVTEFLGV